MFLTICLTKLGKNQLWRRILSKSYEIQHSKKFLRKIIIDTIYNVLPLLIFSLKKIILLNLANMRTKQTFYKTSNILVPKYYDDLQNYFEYFDSLPFIRNVS